MTQEKQPRKQSATKLCVVCKNPRPKPWAQKYCCSRKCSNINRYGNRKESFWTLVEKTDKCWEWTGSTKQGYGCWGMNNRRIDSHRFSYQLHYGDIPRGLCVLHRCDNRKCVRPDHLFLGTRADNQKDMARKGRAAKGEKNGSSKLFSGEVEQIREMQGKMKAKELATLFQISRDYVYELWRFKKWKHLESPARITPGVVA